MNQNRPTKMWCLTLLLCLFELTCSQVSAEQGTEAIVGGECSKKGDFKYHVIVNTIVGKCGGAIINDHYILTAAHCVTNIAGHIIIERFQIIAGINDLHNTHESIVTYADTIYIPKNFDHSKLLHDIAILKLQHSLQISHHHHKLEKINLPKPDKHFDNVCGIVTGFGYQEINFRRNKHGIWEQFGGKSDNKLHFASVRVMTNQKCQEFNRLSVPDTFICGQVLQKNKPHSSGVCDGDSGSPLVYGGEVIGVLSTSPEGCDESQDAAIYTRVSSHLNFINSVIHGAPGKDVILAHVPH